MIGRSKKYFGTVRYILWIFYFIKANILILAEPKLETKLERHESSPFHAFNHRLDLFKYNVQSDLNEADATLNELDDYYNDQTDVRRAWSNDKIKKKHQDQYDLHYLRLASQNVENVLQNGKCKIPTKRCLNVQKMRLGKNAQDYWPPCALVYKCGHDSGCCANSDHSCSPIKSKRIDLYFYSFDFSVPNKERGRVEMLTFENHTECACRPTSMSTLFEETSELGKLLQKKSKSCHCPKHFKKIDEEESCVCECVHTRSKICRKIKKGKRSYNLKGCRGKGHCGEPICDFGLFKRDFGRCPRKSERQKIRRK